jgi:hypothetical protein
MAIASDKDQPEPLRQRYVRELLRLYVATPGVAGRVRRADRQLAVGFQRV